MFRKRVRTLFVHDDSDIVKKFIREIQDAFSSLKCPRMNVAVRRIFDLDMAAHSTYRRVVFFFNEGPGGMDVYVQNWLTACKILEKEREKYMIIYGNTEVNDVAEAGTVASTNILKVEKYQDVFAWWDQVLLFLFRGKSWSNQHYQAGTQRCFSVKTPVCASWEKIRSYAITNMNDQPDSIVSQLRGFMERHGIDTADTANTGLEIILTRSSSLTPEQKNDILERRIQKRPVFIIITGGWETDLSLKPLVHMLAIKYERIRIILLLAIHFGLIKGQVQLSNHRSCILSDLKITESKSFSETHDISWKLSGSLDLDQPLVMKIDTKEDKDWKNVKILDPREMYEVKAIKGNPTFRIVLASEADAIVYTGSMHTEKIRRNCTWITLLSLLTPGIFLYPFNPLSWMIIPMYYWRCKANIICIYFIVIVAFNSMAFVIWLFLYLQITSYLLYVTAPLLAIQTFFASILCDLGYKTYKLSLKC